MGGGWEGRGEGGHCYVYMESMAGWLATSISICHFVSHEKREPLKIINLKLKISRGFHAIVDCPIFTFKTIY